MDRLRGCLGIAAWSILVFLCVGAVEAGLMEAQYETVIIVHIGSVLAVTFAFLRIERKKQSWVNKHQRGFYRVWLVFSGLLVVAFMVVGAAHGLYGFYEQRLTHGEAWFMSLFPAISYIIVFAIGHGCFYVVLWVIRGFSTRG